MLVSHNFVPRGLIRRTLKFPCYIMYSPLRYHIAKEAGYNEGECIYNVEAPLLSTAMWMLANTWHLLSLRHGYPILLLLSLTISWMLFHLSFFRGITVKKIQLLRYSSSSLLGRCHHYHLSMIHYCISSLRSTEGSLLLQMLAFSRKGEMIGRYGGDSPRR